MVGRAALSNPWVFSEILAGLKGEDYVRPDDLETVRVLMDYSHILFEIMPEKGAIGKLKQLASQVTRRVRGSSLVVKAFSTAISVDEFRSLLREWENYLQERGLKFDTYESFESETFLES